MSGKELSLMIADGTLPGVEGASEWRRKLAAHVVKWALGGMLFRRRAGLVQRISAGEPAGAVAMLEHVGEIAVEGGES